MKGGLPVEKSLSGHHNSISIRKNVKQNVKQKIKIKSDKAKEILMAKIKKQQACKE